jgi:hypothetical protein
LVTCRRFERSSRAHRNTSWVPSTGCPFRGRLLARRRARRRKIPSRRLALHQKPRPSGTAPGDSAAAVGALGQIQGHRDQRALHLISERRRTRRPGRRRVRRYPQKSREPLSPRSPCPPTMKGDVTTRGSCERTRRHRRKHAVREYPEADEANTPQRDGRTALALQTLSGCCLCSRSGGSPARRGRT